MLILGPCSVESKKQFFDTAKAINDLFKPDYIRGGVWKPRTRPGNFEGLGEQALIWMSEFKNIYNVKLAVEVANKDQAKLALKYGIDLLWIGARTTGNPFSVQELADYLSDYDVPVYIKNPLNPDISLWLGAVERFQKAGCVKIGLIHRGFTSSIPSLFRNQPMWHIAMEVKNIFNSYPMICDPSHISGKRDLINDICQNAYDLQYDGLMIESHINPELALSDSEQQLKPIDLKKILDKINFFKNKSVENNLFINNHPKKTLIEIIDNELITLLVSRKQLIDSISSELFQEKKDLNIERKIVDLSEKNIFDECYLNKLKHLLLY